MDADLQHDPQYIRAVTRDMRMYIKKHCSRHIPVGYSAADVRPLLKDSWAYFQCAIDGNADEDMSRSEFFGLNSYSWCGQSSFTESTYSQLATMFKSTSVPVFFSEYGCNEVKPRIFQEVGTLYGPQMTMLSGGLVYEYSMEANDYGLVNTTDSSVALNVDYDNLQSQLNKVDFSKIQSATGSTASPPTCDASLIDSSDFSSNFTLPDWPPNVEDLINNGVNNPPSGKIVSVSNTKTSQTIKSSSGKTLNNVELQEVHSANKPSGASTSSGDNGNVKGAAMGAAAPVTALLAAGMFVAAVLL